MGLSLKQKVGLELQRSLRHNEAQLHPLRTLFWECTLRCNMSCRHCGSDCKVQPDVKDMPAADFLRVIDSITPHVDTHKVFIIFTGGEALLRPDLEEVGLELYRREYPWGVVTNGFLLDERRLESLMASGMHSITVSLDGFEEQHNWIRRHPQSFEKATAAIRLLAQQKDILWDVVTCVNPRNYPHLKEFREYLVSLGVPAWRLFSIFPMGRAAGNPELQFTDEQFRGLLDFIKECRNTPSPLRGTPPREGESQLAQAGSSPMTAGADSFHRQDSSPVMAGADSFHRQDSSPMTAGENSFHRQGSSPLQGEVAEGQRGVINVSYACEGFLGEYEQKVRDHFFHCRSGVDVASIRCDGAISGCTSVRSHMDQGNIYRDDFWDVWENRFQVMRDRSWARKDQCASCKVWRYCEGSGLHLYDDEGRLLTCHYNRLKK
jgi:radical SAM protein with 4Fe4S-binding SPASM domain